MCVHLSEIWHSGLGVLLEKGPGGRSRTSWAREVLCILPRGPLAMQMGSWACHPGQGKPSSWDLFCESGSVPRMCQGCQTCEYTLLSAVCPMCRLPFHTPTPKGPEEWLTGASRPSMLPIMREHLSRTDRQNGLKLQWEKLILDTGENFQWARVGGSRGRWKHSGDVENICVSGEAETQLRWGQCGKGPPEASGLRLLLVRITSLLQQ